MRFLVTHRHAAFVGLFGVFVSLFLYTWSLNPSLKLESVLALSVLRCCFLGIPLVFGWLLVRLPRVTGARRVLTWMGWLFFLPGTLSSITEIRHVAELCRLAGGGDADVCIDRVWMLYPIFMYAVAGMGIFVFTLSQVSTKLIFHSFRKRMVILSLCLYASTVSVLGLYEGFDARNVFSWPVAIVWGSADILTQPSFYINAMISFLFTSVLFFVLNRILYRAHRFIFE